MEQTLANLAENVRVSAEVTAAAKARHTAAEAELSAAETAYAAALETLRRNNRALLEFAAGESK